MIKLLKVFVLALFVLTVFGHGHHHSDSSSTSSSSVSSSSSSSGSSSSSSDSSSRSQTSKDIDDLKHDVDKTIQNGKDGGQNIAHDASKLAHDAANSVESAIGTSASASKGKELLVENAEDEDDDDTELYDEENETDMDYKVWKADGKADGSSRNDGTPAFVAFIIIMIAGGMFYWLHREVSGLRRNWELSGIILKQENPHSTVDKKRDYKSYRQEFRDIDMDELRQRKEVLEEEKEKESNVVASLNNMIREARISKDLNLQQRFSVGNSGYTQV